MSVVVVMRHTLRLDSDPNSTWSDKHTRPYDTPARCLEHPKPQAKKLLDLNITKVVCSPFRRCLQTAAVVCTELGLTQILVNRQVGETMPAVRKLNKEVLSHVDESDHKLIYLSSDESLRVLHAINTSLNIIDFIGEPPAYHETREEGHARFASETRKYCKLIKNDTTHGSILIVSHGDAVATIGTNISNIDIYSVNECGFIVLKPHEDADSDGVHLVTKDNVFVLDEHKTNELSQDKNIMG